MKDDGGKRSRCSRAWGRAEPTVPPCQGSPRGRHMPHLPPSLLQRDGKFFLPVNCCVWRLLLARPHTSISQSCAGLQPGPAVHADRAQGGNSDTAGM